VSAKVELATNFNLLYGSNGSGKTSFLEAIYYLGLGRSFRTRLNSRIIHHGASHFSLFAQIQQEHGLLPIGIERYSNGEGRIRIAQENARSIIELTRILPVQLLNTDSRLLLTGASKLRRQFIDWGVFHVEPTFIGHWQNAQRILKQRNAALRLQSPRAMIQVWDAELTAVAQILNGLRKSHIEHFIEVFNRVIQGFWAECADVTLGYKCGWDESLGLQAVLEKSFSRDLQLGYTQFGPHRADLLIRLNKTTPAHDILSQGQQKLIVYALRLAQGMLLKQQVGKNCVYLLDDLPAELDVDNRRRVVSVLQDIAAQVFVTGVDREVLADLEGYPESRVFHVERRDNPIQQVF